MLSAAARAAAQYQRTAVECGTPLELVVRLYDGAIANIARARDGASGGDLHARKDGLSKAMAIVSQLQSSLDMTAGGEISTSLDALYTYLIGRMVDANTKKDATALDEVHRLLSTLRDGWQQIANALPGTRAQA
ncbi:MAG: flagellar export chaperone FliS [Acidobacteria bacterium]|jgi:flagellar protein FliS|nr:flagellar export chaperone FliS [Acidobacteriota bacterium]